MNRKTWLMGLVLGISIGVIPSARIGDVYKRQRKDLDAALGEVPSGNEDFKKTVAKYLELRTMVNRYGERNIDLVSGFAENIEIPETFVDYSAKPREYPLSTVQTIVRVHTRVSDLYNDPYDQLQEQMRLTIEGIKERQEWEIVNSQKFGLLRSVDLSLIHI